MSFLTVPIILARLGGLKTAVLFIFASIVAVRSQVFYKDMQKHLKTTKKMIETRFSYEAIFDLYDRVDSLEDEN